MDWENVCGRSLSKLPALVLRVLVLGLGVAVWFKMVCSREYLFFLLGCVLFRLCTRMGWIGFLRNREQLICC